MLAYHIQTGRSFDLGRILHRNAKMLRALFPPVLRILLLKLILLYQRRFSRHTCLYQPTCSQYMVQALTRYGVILGLCMGTLRILRCNPLSKGGYDPVPELWFRFRWLL